MNETTATPAIIPAQIVICRCCLRPITPVWQPGLATPEGFHLLTCHNPACALNGHTFGDRDYVAIDLSRYHARQHPAYADVQAAINRALAELAHEGVCPRCNGEQIIALHGDDDTPCPQCGQGGEVVY